MAVTDNLQTNGLCLNHCLGKAAFAITKGYDCWCSNYAPAKDVQVDLADCNFPCWGYPDEPCGGQNGEYSYVRLRDVDPSGTRGAEEPSSTSTKPSKTQAVSRHPSTTHAPAVALPCLACLACLDSAHLLCLSRLACLACLAYLIMPTIFYA